MQGEPKQAGSAKVALLFITVGALMTVWTLVYYVYLQRRPESTDNSYLVCLGFFLTGLVLMAIGFGVGRIGRSARESEVAAAPPVVVPPGSAGPTAAVPTAGGPTIGSTAGSNAGTVQTAPGAGGNQPTPIPPVSVPGEPRQLP